MLKQSQINKLAIKYIALADALDKEGLSKEAALIDMEIAYAIDNGILKTNFNKNSMSQINNTKTAIRGQSTWNDYAHDMAAGAAGGAAATIAGGPTALVGAGIGAGLGAANTFAGDLWFNKVQGRWTKATSLANDFKNTSTQLATLLAEINPELSQQLMAYSETPIHQVQQQSQARKEETAQNVGLDPKGGFLQTITHPGQALEQWKQMRASAEQKMQRTAAADDSPLGNFTDTQSIAQKLNPALKSLDWKSGLKGGLYGAAGAMVGGGAYNLIANAIRGKEGQIKKLATELGQIGAALAQLTGSQGHARIANSLSTQALGVLQQAGAGQQAQGPQAQPPQMQTNQGYRQPNPQQYTPQNNWGGQAASPNMQNYIAQTQNLDNM